MNFGAGDADARKAATEAVISKVQSGGVLFAGGAHWHGEWVMRISVTSGATTAADIEVSADAIVAAWREVGDTQ